MSFAQPFSGYEILARLGSGSMGTVFKARQKHMNRVVALKVLKPSLARDAHFVDRLRREARIVGKLNHPNIVMGYDLGEEGGYHFFVMEFVEGRSLRQLLNEWGMFPEEQVLDVAMQIADALAHAYACGVIHRDIKPANVLIDEDGRVKLTDMGLAKGPTDATLTRDGATVGTPQYISPEQARNPQTVDVRSDLYSLGATLFHMATGSPPFKADTIGELITKVLHERAASAAELNPALSDGLSLVIRKLLAKHPRLRYQTPAELLEDLERVSRSERPLVDVRRLDREAAYDPARRKLWVLGSVAGAVVVGLCSWAFWPDRERDASAGARTVAEYRTRLHDRVEGRQGYRQRFDLLRREMDDAVDPARRGVIQDERQALVDRLRGELAAFFDGFLAEHVDEVESWFGEMRNWEEPDRFLTQTVAPEIEARFGYGPLVLPDERLRADVDERLTRLGLRIAAIRDRKDAAYRARYDDYLRTEARPAVEAELARSDFAAAERALRVSLESFHGNDDRPPLAKLPAELRESLERRGREFEEEALGRIQRRQTAAAESMRRSAQHRLDALERLAKDLIATGTPPGILRDGLDGLERDLAAANPPPSAFASADVDPWPEVEERLTTMRRELGLLERRFDEKVLDAALRLAYRFALTRGPTAAIRVLEVGRPLNDRVEIARARQLAALSRARRFARALLSAVLAGQDSFTVKVRHPATGVDSEVVLRPGPSGDVAVVRAGTGAAVTYADIDFEELAGHPRVGTELRASFTSDPELREGRAFWLLATGRPDPGLALLSGEPLAFYRDQWPRFEELIQVGRARTEDAAADLFARALAARDKHDPAAARRFLEAFDKDHGDTAFARDQRSRRADLDDWIRRQDARAQREAVLGARAGPGVVVQVGDDLSARVEYRLHTVGDYPWPEGWRARGDHLQFDSAPIELATSAARALEVDDPFESEQEIEALFRLQLEPAGRDPQLLILHVHGATVAFASLPGAMAFARVLPAGTSDRPAALRSELADGIAGLAQRAAAEPPAVVPGAIHELRVHVTPRKRYSDVVVKLDGVELARERVTRATEGTRVAVQSLQGVGLWGLELSGR